YFDLGQRDTAIDLARDTYTKYPDNVSITRLYIQLLLADQQGQEIGTNLLEKAMEKFPEDSILQFLKARLLYSKGTRPDLDEASDILNKILEHQPENIQAWLLAGEIEFNRQQYQRVVDIIYQGLSFNPGNQDLLLLKARAENEFSPELAVATMKTLQSINTSDANIAIKLATIYASQGNNTEALGLLETAEKLTNNQDQIEAVKLLRSLIEYRSGNVNAKEYAINILAQKPDNISAFSVLLEIYISDQNWDLTRSTIEQWQKNNSENTDSLFEAIRILARKRDMPQAKDLVIEICNNILAIKPGNIDAMQIKASLDLIGKNNSQAMNIYREILANDPKNTIAINNMAWMLCEDQNNPQEALKLALQGLEHSPEYADLIDTTGVIYYKLGEYQKSEEMLLKCINLYNTNNPALTGTFFHLGRTYYKLKNSVQAGVYLKKALEYNEVTNVLSDIEIAEIYEMLK
ncbi:MAG: tetratricopeptide repeat protein, partial [Sedimentisphaerales bacterium]|nr:tetratricopeptide repeat protein [Sedimentisphaerales bacterium]